jgi:hypothetical protein
MRALPISATGFPVPWFVAWARDGVEVPRGTGEPEFRAFRSTAVAQAHGEHLCWLCGQPLGRFMAFVVGPMCAINRVSSEPPSHRECAEYAVRACPFLTRPRMRRNEKDVPPGFSEIEGMIKRNPGVALIWVTRSYRLQKVNPGTLFVMGEPTHYSWWCEGRAAKRAEVEQSLETGLPALLIEAERQGMISAVPGELARTLKMLPAETQSEHST